MIGFTPIGIIHTPFPDPHDIPIQPTGGTGVEGTVEVFEPYREGLADLDGFSHVILLYHLHRSSGYEMRVVPYLDEVPRGLFATRTPRRPNPIGLSIVRLARVEPGILHVEDLDVVDGTPLLDIKPYIPELEPVDRVRVGWLEGLDHGFREHRSNGRFA